MNLRIFFVFALLVFFTITLDAHAYFRYAVVIGNNNGVDENGDKASKDLTKAEELAKELYDSLIKLANFKKENIILLQGTTRSEVLAAVEQLKNKMESDRQTFGNPDTLFALFFIGHGENGQLLTYEAPLTAEDINRIFEELNADVKIGFFDACFSGSLDPKMLKAPNILHKLHQNVLRSQGSAWFTSSKKDQYSHEDKKLGGVLTHFFIEALQHAHHEGPSITLDSIWDYTNKNTINYTSDRDHGQNPIRKINMEQTGTLHFSFPEDRSASLVLEKSVEGNFILNYPAFDYSETFSKSEGDKKSIAVFPGKAQLRRLGYGGSTIPFLLFEKGKAIHLFNDQALPATLGEKMESLTKKRYTLKSVMIHPKLNLMLGVQFELSDWNSALLIPNKIIGLGLRINWRALSAGFSIGYGYDSNIQDSRNYKVHALKGSAHLGYGFNLDLARLSLAASISVSSLWKTFENRDKNSDFSIAPTMRVGFIYPTNKSFMFEIILNLGILNAPVISQSIDKQWTLYMSAGLWVGYLFY